MLQFFIFEKFLNVTILGLPDFFSLGPFFFDRVEVRGVRREVKQSVPSGFNGLFHISSFVESRVVHDNDALGREFRKEVLLYPSCENFGVDVDPEETHGQQRFAKEGADGVRPPLRTPIVLSNTSLTTQSIAVGARRIMGEARLIQKYDRLGSFCVRFNRFLEGLPCVCARPWMPKAFFYR